MNVSKIMPKVFLWMFVGLAVTFLTGSIISHNPSMILDIFTKQGVFLLALVEIVLVIVLAARIHKMSATTAKILFILYSFITGITFSSIFIMYKIESITYVFLATALIMLIFAFIGAKTKLDLTKLGTFLFMAIIGILILMIINMFMSNEHLDLVLCIASLVVFILYIAFDVQKIVRLYEAGYMPEENLAIYGAFQLYIDFINIFLDLLRLIGDNN